MVGRDVGEIGVDGEIEITKVLDDFVVDCFIHI